MAAQSKWDEKTVLVACHGSFWCVKPIAKDGRMEHDNPNAGENDWREFLFEFTVSVETRLAQNIPLGIDRDGHDVVCKGNAARPPFFVIGIAARDADKIDRGPDGEVIAKAFAVKHAPGEIALAQVNLLKYKVALII